MNNKVDYAYADNEKKLFDETINTLIVNVEKELSSVNSENSIESINHLFAIQKYLIPVLLHELKNPARDYFRTKVLEKLNTVIKTSLDTVLKLRECEVSENIDVSNPKLQLLFSWFIDCIRESMVEADFTNENIRYFFEKFSGKLIGWEEKANKKLSRVSIKTIQQSRDAIENPFK